MAKRLKRFWSVPAIWSISLCLLFGFDVVDLGLDETLDTARLLGIFSTRKVVYPEALVIITSLLQQGLNDIIRSEDQPSKPSVSASTKTVAALSQDAHGSATDDLADAVESKCKCDCLTLL